MAKQAEHLKTFMTVALGGPNNYTGRSLRDAHARLVKNGLDNSHFDAVLGHLAATLKELDVPEELIAEAAVIVESVRVDVLGK
jgi:hemoglobin